jgi:hypothetical protein
VTTAAEKFDKVPPWCRVNAASVSHIGTTMFATSLGVWQDRTLGIPAHPVADLHRIARLTRPLDSWEPAPDCPLPVAGWRVEEHAKGLVGLYDEHGEYVPGFVYPAATRRAAIVYAWAEAEAPVVKQDLTTDAHRPITEADVKAGLRLVYDRLGRTEEVTKVRGQSVNYDYTEKASAKVVRDSSSCGLAWFVTFANDNHARIITDGTGAKDGPDREAINALDDRIGAVETKVEDMADVLARICPEADSQTDGKGRTLVEINRELDAQIQRINFIDRLAKDANTAATDACDTVNALKARVEADATANRNVDLGVEHRLKLLENAVKRLSAAQVAKPATLNTRSDDASTNEVMTEAAAVDDGWREQLVSVQFHPGGMVFLITPNRKMIYSTPSLKWAEYSDVDHSVNGKIRIKCDDSTQTSEYRRTCPPPPNLAEWYKPKAALSDGTLAAPLAVVTAERDAAREAVPSVFRDDDLAKSVRNLAAAHEQAVKAQEQYRQRIAELERSEGDLAVDNVGWMHDVERLNKELAAAQESARQAEGRAHTAMKRASKAEEELADLRAKLETALK